MSQVLPGTSIYRALKAEGFALPENCGDVTLELPVDGVIVLHYRIMVDTETLAMIGRALERLAKEGS